MPAENSGLAATVPKSATFNCSEHVDGEVAKISEAFTFYRFLERLFGSLHLPRSMASLNA